MRGGWVRGGGNRLKGRVVVGALRGGCVRGAGRREQIERSCGCWGVAGCGPVVMRCGGCPRRGGSKRPFRVNERAFAQGDTSPPHNLFLRYLHI
ncbi:MAG: hypothetical protein LBG17_06590 [Bacteroidales bacterium]|nr:hypothetical protein [Bacteroidales bacterium]